MALHAVIVAGAMWIGAPPIVLAALVVGPAVPAPLLAMAAVGAAVWTRRGSATAGAGEAAFLRSLSAELQAGATIRSALAAAARTSHVTGLDVLTRLAPAGRPLPELAAVVRRSMPQVGIAAAAAINVVATSGARAAAVFGELAGQADAAIALERERSASTAQARLSAMVVAGIPVVGVLLVTATGRGHALAGSGAPGRLVMGVGAALLAAGSLAIVVMLRRAARPTRSPDVALLGEMTLLGVSAGLPLAAALRMAASESEPRLEADVAAVLRAAHQGGLAASLERSVGPAQDLMRLLATASATGAPIRETLRGFVAEERLRRHAARLEQARRLPVRLLLPLSLLILPGFILLVAGPLVLDGVAGLRG